MTDKPPAEQIADLLAELHDHVTTREEILTPRSVIRGKRAVVLVEKRPHTVKEPGLLTQLGVVAGRQEQVPVQVRRWVLDATKPDPRDPARTICARGCRLLCSHGHWVHDHTETRPATTIVTGASVPGGSPGWDADGALSPIVGGKNPEPPEPVAEAWHTADEIRRDLRDLGAELHEQGWRRPHTLVSIALEDEPTGWEIVTRLRSMVNRARITASYDAPIVTLRDVVCPVCGSELRVRKDASSAVWCSGFLPLHGPAREGEQQPIGSARCGASWPRGGWVGLLDAVS